VIQGLFKTPLKQNTYNTLFAMQTGNNGIFRFPKHQYIRGHVPLGMV